MFQGGFADSRCLDFGERDTLELFVFALKYR